MLLENDGTDRSAVDELEVVRINPILRHHLWVHPQVGVMCTRLWSQSMKLVRGAMRRECESISHLPIGIASGGVVPYVNGFIPFGDRPCSQPPRPVRPVLIWDRDVAPIESPYPAVEGALNSVVDDRSAVRQTRTKVPAMTVVHSDITAAATVG